VALQQTSQVTGGTGLFANASGDFTGTVGVRGLLPRDPDGSRSTTQPSLHGVDKIAFSGTLLF
jgi:hypothetical protein